MMTEIEFEAIAREGYNRIALVSECLCDLETPLSIYLKLAGRDTDTIFAGKCGRRQKLFTIQLCGVKGSYKDR